MERPDDARPADGGRRVRRWSAALALPVAGLLALVGAGVVVGRTVSGPAAAPAPAPALPSSVPSSVPPVAPVGDAPWVRTWQAAPQPPVAGSFAARGLAARTARMRVRTSVGGSALRLTLSNAYGPRPLVVTAATVALPAQETGSLPAARPGTVRPLTFAGRTTVAVPARGTAVSDALAFEVPAHADLLVSVAFGAGRTPLTGHIWALSTTWLSAAGDPVADRTADVDGSGYPTPVDVGLVATALDVVPVGRRALPTVVAFGDSITDGVGSTVDADRRWPDLLAGRLPGVAVVNAGIGANRLVSDAPNGGDAATSRYARDALEVPGADAVVLLEGINDIQRGARTGQVTAALATLGDRARSRGLRVVVATLTPYGGRRTWSPQGERTRQAVNAWIRTRAVQEGHADVVVDLDAVLRDPADRTRLAPAFDSGDRIHPDDDGYAEIAAAVEPALRAVLPLGTEPAGGVPPTRSAR